MSMNFEPFHVKLTYWLFLCCLPIEIHYRISSRFH